ncbi:hypothetical protein L6164_017772 [Bauhinia variegata]|uniref:Uncharacterized protein n=1 Tax=Bauhinia variegata TaxID=167791 RepID=A0ACB9NB48_BAUVA|nr:hypothetical protein L6164_017772 [Bauhinia variegata]
MKREPGFSSGNRSSFYLFQNFYNHYSGQWRDSKLNSILVLYYKVVKSKAEVEGSLGKTRLLDWGKGNNTVGFLSSFQFSQGTVSKINMNHTNLVIDVEAIMVEPESPRDECCIYKVAYHIRKLNVEAYTPNVVSIGPLHHFDQRLQNMERCKRVYFKQFVAQTKIRLEDLISSMEEAKPRLRLSYSRIRR